MCDPSWTDCGRGVSDAAIQHGLALLTATDRHYRIIPALEMEVFRP